MKMYLINLIRIIIDTPKKERSLIVGEYITLLQIFYKPNPDRLRDWISTSKSNGYEFYIRTVMGPDGKWVEVQIRTKRMDDIFLLKGYSIGNIKIIIQKNLL